MKKIDRKELYNLDHTIIDGSLYKKGKRLFEEVYPSENYDDYTQKGFSDKYKINKYGYIVNS